MNKQQLVKEFLKNHTVEDVQTPVNGELLEFATNNATYFFGNGELIIAPADASQDESTYVVDRIGFNPILVEY